MSKLLIGIVIGLFVICELVGAMRERRERKEDGKFKD